MTEKIKYKHENVIKIHVSEYYFDGSYHDGIELWCKDFNIKLKYNNKDLTKDKILDITNKLIIANKDFIKKDYTAIQIIGKYNGERQALVLYEKIKDGWKELIYGVDYKSSYWFSNKEVK